MSKRTKYRRVIDATVQEFKDGELYRFGKMAILSKSFDKRKQKKRVRKIRRMHTKSCAFWISNG